MTYDTINDARTMAGNGEGALLANRYRIIRQLGQGGMGSVWLAEDTQLDNKPFAIKMLPAILVSNKRAYRQLKDEALVAMKLTHSNIVTLRAFEENSGNPFLVMDYIDGQTLDDYLAEHALPLGGASQVGEAASRRFNSAQVGEAASRRFTGTTGVSPVARGLPESDVLRILRPIAAALDYAHTKGVVHRDVKPGNVMIAKDGTPYILDFGIAREIQETMTRVTGKLSSGTLLYMSPEQLMGESPKPAQDVYSFAAMAYECLKGEPPFVRGAIEDQIKNKQPEPLPTEVLTGKAAILAAGIMSGLAKKLEARPATCTAVLEGSVFSRKERKDAGAVALVATETGGARLPRPPEPLPGRAGAPRPPQSGMWKGVTLAVVLGLAVAGGITWWVFQKDAPKKTARQERSPKTEETRNTSNDAVVTNVTSRSSNPQPQPQQVLATVRAETTGHINEICVKSGDLVEKGQILFKLDDAPLRAAVTLRKAELELAEAECRRAQRFWERIQKTDFRGITQKEHDDAEAGTDSSRAAVLRSRANLRREELELKKANIIAPVSGRIRLVGCIGEAVSPDSPFLAEILSSNSRIDAGDGTIQEVVVYPRTKGRVTKICINDGQFVKRGDLLCQLDDEQATLLVDQRKVDLEEAEAECRRAERYWERMQKADARGITQKERDDAEAGVEKAKAEVCVARARLVLAESEYASTKVIAPASGIITRIHVRIGDVVSPDKTAIVKMSRCTEFGAFRREAEKRSSSSERVSMRNRTPDGKLFGTTNYVGVTKVVNHPSPVKRPDTHNIQPIHVRGYVPYDGPTKDYIVKSGDSLGKIASESGISIRALKALNGLQNDSLRAGMRLKVPAAKQTSMSMTAPTSVLATPAPAPAATPPHQQPSAESAELIRLREKLLRANEELKAEQASGSSRQRQQVAAYTGPYYEYVVEKGQTLSFIAKGFDTTVSKILAANPGLAQSGLRVGQKLIIPAE